MSENTKIEWCDHTFNPWTGCMKVSPGCDRCYAEGWSKRAGAKVGKWGAGAPRVRTTAANWKLPMKWEAGAEAFRAAHGRRQRVFCASLADVFDNEVDPQWRADILRLVDQTPNLDWLLLTKRIGNANVMLDQAEMIVCGSIWTNYRPRPNIWLGATVVNQEEADRDIPKLLATPARVRFLSMEPLLGPVDLRFPTKTWAPDRCNHCCNGDRCDTPGHHERARCPYCRGTGRQKILEWVITGGESGPGARPAHPRWFRSVAKQCRAAGVPFLFKQWGEWAPYDRGRQDGWLLATPYSLDEPISKFGKKASGRLLDGVEHNGFPS